MKDKTLLRYPTFNNYFSNIKTQIFVSTQISTSSEERQCCSRFVLLEAALTDFLKHLSNLNLSPSANSVSIGCSVVTLVICAKFEKMSTSFPSGKSLFFAAVKKSGNKALL